MGTGKNQEGAFPSYTHSFGPSEMTQVEVFAKKECTGTVASSCLSRAWSREKIKDRGC